MVTARQQATRQDPATALFDRKLALLDKLSCRQLFEDLAVEDGRVLDLSRQVAESKVVMSGARAAVEESATLAAINVEGKNETERKQRTVATLAGDMTYQAAVAALREEERTAITIQADLDAAKSRMRRIERRIEYQTSILQFLGG